MEIILKKNDKNLFDALNKEFKSFQKNNANLFIIDITNDQLNLIFKKHVQKTPLFRSNPEWDCSYCRHAIRNVAKIVCIENNKKISFLQYFMNKYNLKFNYLFLYDMFLDYINLVQSTDICNVFYYVESSTIGIKENLDPSTGLVFDHFYFNVDPKYQVRQDVNNNFSRLKAVISKYHSHIDILKDITFYIEEGHIYRGSEKLQLIKNVINFLQQFKSDNDLNLFIWKNIFSESAFFSNDVISTLADNLIAGEDVDSAVQKYNTKVAPENYRQPKTTIVTSTQINQCETALKDMGYDNFTEGFAFAEPQDISVLDVLWTNRKVTKTGKLSDLLVENIKPSTINNKNMTKISFVDFLNLLKTTKEIEIDDTLEKVVLIKDKFNEPVFAWNNHINFCYQTGLADTDMVSQKVKAKGGNIDAKIRFSLYWENLDDLDLHLENNNCHIYWDHQDDSNTSFQLDIDMNVSSPVRGAVENIFTKRINKNKDIDQEFTVYVRNFRQRENPQKCLLNVYYNNKLIKQYNFKNPEDSKIIKLLKYKITKDEKLEFIWSNKQVEKKVQLETKFVKVDTVLLSPNYWENGKGNKHIFFLKKGKNIELTNLRPYNIEQLRPELIKYKKVLQLLSRKIEIKGKPQLTGYGTSFSKKRKLLIKINNKPYILSIDPSIEIEKNNLKQLMCA